MDSCRELANQKAIPVTKIQTEVKALHYNLFFSINASIFEEFLLKFGKEVGYSYKNGLLKVQMEEQDSEEKMISVIN